MKRSLGETIFDFPRLYETKIAFLKAVNGYGGFLLDSLTEGKDVLDIGCGSRQIFYHPEKTRRRVGIDPSPSFIAAAKKRYPSSSHLLAGAENFSVPPKSFDVALLLFVLHHLSPETWAAVLEKARMAARESVVILDHIRHDALIPSLIQRLWWGLADGGKIYRREKEWPELLKSFEIREYRRMGALFGNVCYFLLKPRT